MASADLREREAVLHEVDPHGAPLGKLSREQLAGQLVLQLLLDYPLQRPGAIHRVVAEPGDLVERAVGALERDHWLVCMLSAVNELVADDGIRAQMTEYFVKAAEHLRNDQPLRLVKP